MNSVKIGDRLPKRGNRLTRGFGATILRWFGWRMVGEIPNRDKLVVIAAPHTTGWDFGVGLMTIFALGIEVSWLGADWVVRFPLMRRLGGVAVDRSKNHGLVAAVVKTFQDRDKFLLALAPEGSRKKVVPWKAGFYHIARGARVPILMVAIDHKKRLLRFGPAISPSGDFKADMKEVREVYTEFLEQHPDRFGM